MKSLDRCQNCRVGVMKTYTTRSVGSRRHRYLRCDHCRATGQEIVYLDERGRVLNWRTIPSMAMHSNAGPATYDYGITQHNGDPNAN